MTYTSDVQIGGRIAAVGQRLLESVGKMMTKQALEALNKELKAEVGSDEMKPAPFEYFRPRSLDEALALLAEHGGDAKPLAGGQSLIPAMNFRLATPSVLVDLNGLRELSYITDGAGDVRIGGMTRQRTVERSTLVSERAPLVTETMPHIAHPAIRNRGTIGGSLAHADPAAELPAVMLALKARLMVSEQAGHARVSPPKTFSSACSQRLSSRASCSPRFGFRRRRAPQRLCVSGNLEAARGFRARRRSGSRAARRSGPLRAGAGGSAQRGRPAHARRTGSGGADRPAAIGRVDSRRRRRGSHAEISIRRATSTLRRGIEDNWRTC